MRATPIYELLKRTRKGQDSTANVSKSASYCVDGPAIHRAAWGPNKKMAEQKAALLALEEMGVMEPSEVDEAIETIVEEEGTEK